MSATVEPIEPTPLSNRVVVVERLDLAAHMWISVWAMSSGNGKVRTASISLHSEMGCVRAVQDIELPLDVAAKLSDVLQVAVESATQMGEMSAEQWKRFEAYRAAAEAKQGGAA